MEVRRMDRQDTRLKQEIMLQVNERLYIQGVISKALYERAKVKIVETAI